MGLPNKDFIPQRRLTEDEAAIMARAALARARATLAHSRRMAAPGPARTAPSGVLARFAEGLIVLGSGLACLLVWLVSRG